jgi:hypothetical protein
MKGRAMIRTTSASLFAALAIFTVGAGTAWAQPNPIIYLTHAEHVTVRGQALVRYHYDVFNRDQYPAAMFAAAPALPPCGSNANASRAWVDILDGRTNRRLNGFCALGNPANMSDLWFALPEGELPPSYIYLEINDRQTNTKYRSNLADTVQ